MSEAPSGTITFLFTDIEGSTQLWEHHPDAMQAALARHNEILRKAIESHGGYVFKTVGDAFCAAFASAPRALSTALAAQRALRSEGWDEAIGAIRVRMALHTGTVEEQGGDYFGPPVNRVARLEAAAHGGQILLSLTTQELTCDDLPPGVSLSDLGRHRLKDLFRPEHIFQVNAPDLPAEFPPLRTLDTKRTNLPAQPTSFIGRERELVAVLGLLRRDDVRLVTLTGPGGTGKTRLSLQAATNLLDEYKHGVYFVDLAPIIDPDLAISTVAGTLGVREMGSQPITETLKAYLREKQMLLVLDNFEQIVEAAPLVSDLLVAAPRLKIMTTSREVLCVYGEHVYPVPPLGLPEPKREQTVAVLSQYEAVMLFTQRAKAVKQDFEISEANAPAIAEVCVRLDGLPLAIELAAARARMLSPEAMLERMGSRLKALTGRARDLPARQRTLRGAIDWSYNLLDEDEKILFVRLGVFQGGRNVEAVKAICSHNLAVDALDGLESLLNKSLLRQEEGLDGEPRFVILETILEYARERLEQSGEAEALRKRHADYFLALAERAEPELRGARQGYWSARLRVEHDNLRAALAWSLGGADVGWGLRLAGALRDFWFGEGHSVEGRRWTERALESAEDAPLALRAKALNAAGFLSFYHGDHEQGQMLNGKALALYRELGDKANSAWALTFLSSHSMGDPDGYKKGMTLCEKGLALFRELSDKPGMAHALSVLGELARLDGDYERARTAYEECLAVCRETGMKRREAITLGNLAYVAQHQGDHEQAEALVREGLILLRELGFKYTIAIGLALLAGPVGAKGQPERAARLFGASEAFLEAMGIGQQAGDQSEVDRYVATAREQLDEATFEAAWAEGRAMSLEQAIEYALWEGDDD